MNLRLHGKAVFVLMMFFYAFSSGAVFAGEQQNNGMETLVVHGTGYPPIRAQNLAQARLLAKRAAVVDAYRNALAAIGTRMPDEDILYPGLSGFVKGLTLMEEEYLKDGGIRILARIPVKDITTAAGIANKSQKSWSPGPLKVTQEEWYRIIKDLVRTESNNNP